MYIRYQKMYSEMLGRDMEYKIYGHSGRPVLYIPCQDGRFYDFENFGMLILKDGVSYEKDADSSNYMCYHCNMLCQL